MKNQTQYCSSDKIKKQKKVEKINCKKLKKNMY